jgi:hypothetical protein
MALTIEDYCFRVGIRGRFLHEANDFAKAQGRDVCVKILKQIYKNRQERVSDGLSFRKSAVTEFKEMAERHVRLKAQSAKQDAEQEEWEESKRASRKAKRDGYEANPETLRDQLEEQLATCEISIKQYEHGIIGLNLVHGVVGLAQGAEDEIDPAFGF